MTGVVVAEGLAIVILAVVVYNLLRTLARVLELLGAAGDPIPPLPPPGPAVPARPSRIGTEAGAVVGVDPSGVAARTEVRTGPVSVLTFLTSSCSTCQTFWAALAGGAAERLPGHPRLTVVTPGPGLESRRQVAELAAGRVSVVMSADAWSDYAVTGSPFAVVVREGKVVAEGPVLDWDGLVGLVS